MASKAPGAAAQWCAQRGLGDMVSKELLDILACPSCKKPVVREEPAPGDDAQEWLVCTACGLRYPVRDDIPIMLIDEASPPRKSPDGQ